MILHIKLNPAYMGPCRTCMWGKKSVVNMSRHQIKRRRHFWRCHGVWGRGRLNKCLLTIQCPCVGVVMKSRELSSSRGVYSSAVRVLLYCAACTAPTVRLVYSSGWWRGAEYSLPGLRLSRGLSSPRMKASKSLITIINNLSSYRVPHNPISFNSCLYMVVSCVYFDRFKLYGCT